MGYFITFEEDFAMKTIVKKTNSEKKTTKTKYEVPDWVVDMIAERIPSVKIIQNLKKLTK